MFKKVILQGRFEFGRRSSYEKVTKMFEHMVNVRYKAALLITEEQFDDETMILNLDRMVLQASDKYFKNTLDILRYVSQFAVSGTVGAWMIDDGRLKEAQIIEPDSDKMVVQAYRKGKKLSEQVGMEAEAIKALEEALERYDQHSQAYERRGHVNYRLGNVEDAIYDFTKSIKLDGRNAAAHLGRGFVYYDQKKYEAARVDFEEATKMAVALQPMYWIARRNKGKCHMKLEEWTKAEFDLKLFTNRFFPKIDPNYQWRQWAFSEYGTILLELGKFVEAVDAYTTALSLNEEDKTIRAEQLLNRGKAKKQGGSKGFLSDWKEAATLGHSEAQKLIANHN